MLHFTRCVLSGADFGFKDFSGKPILLYVGMQVYVVSQILFGWKACHWYSQYTSSSVLRSTLSYLI